MKLSVWFVVLGMGIGLELYGQNAGGGVATVSAGNSTAGTNTTQTEVGSPLAPPAGLELAPPRSAEKPPLQVGGPLAYPFTSRRVSEVPGKLWQLINPLAPLPPRPTIVRVGRLSSRPWAATTGWNPGKSAFPDVTTDEASMTFISVRRAP